MAPLDPVRILVRVHGHLGWLAALALLHPAIVLRRTRRRAHLAVGLSTALVTLTFGVGVGIYGDYRDRLRQVIFQQGPRIGFLFERKEHLAFGALLLAWAGTAAYVGGHWAPDATREPLRRASHAAFVAAAALAVVTATLGIVVAAFRSF